MCNTYGLTHPITRINQRFGRVQLPILFPEGLPNLEPRDTIRPTDPVPVVRAEGGRAVWSTMRWVFPPARPKAGPIINFRSEGRSFTSGRCLMPASFFFEFTGAKAPKSKWRFAFPDEEPFCIAGFWRDGEAGAAVTMLTIPPGPDVEPYHDRQIVPLPPERWRDWLDVDVPAETVLQPGPVGTLSVIQVR